MRDLTSRSNTHWYRRNMPGIKLLTVEDRFLIEGRGVLLLPMIPEYSGPMSLPVVLRKPNGDEAIAQADLEIPRINNPPPPAVRFACLLKGVEKQDVPIGTEIWISQPDEP